MVMARMMRHLHAALALLQALLLWAAMVAGAGAQDSVKVGVLAHRGEAVALSRWRETFRYLDERIGSIAFEMTPLTLSGVSAALDRGEIDLLLTNPGHYEAIGDDYRLSPIVSLRTDRNNRPATGNRYGAVIFVRSDDVRTHTLSGLKDRSLAAVVPNAFGGFLIAAHTLMQNGVDPWRDLKAIKFLGFPQDRIVEAVMRGEADAGTVRTGVLESMIRDKRIRRSDIRLLNPTTVPGFDLMLSTALFPEWILAASRSVPDGLRRDVAIALLSLDEDHAAAVAGKYGGWTTVMHGGAVREVLRSAHPAGKRDLASSSVSSYWLAAIAIATAVAAGILLRDKLPVRSILPGGAPLGSAGVRLQGTEEVRLTPRECEILHLVEHGMTTKEIARHLGISPKTVEFHRGHLMKKFEAHNVAELVHKARSVSGLESLQVS